MGAYYNEIDPEKAQWIRELILAGVVAPGDVDERSITDVQPDDLRGYRQCHFFAGIAVWSYALRLAGWPDDREVWTGSCPCPSFSLAGEKQGLGDPRHLWPNWFQLTRERKPATILGEQVDSAISFGWLDLVQSDLEAEGYAVGKAVLTNSLMANGKERLVRMTGKSLRENCSKAFRLSEREEKVAKLIEAATVTIQHFERNNVSGNFQGDDEHECWNALRAAALSALGESKGKYGRHEDNSRLG